MLFFRFTRGVLLADNRTQLFQTMQKLLALLLHSARPQLTPNLLLQIVRPPGFLPGHEQDSSEFLSHLLETLHEQEKLRKLENRMEVSQPSIKEKDEPFEHMDIEESAFDNKRKVLQDNSLPVDDNTVEEYDTMQTSSVLQSTLIQKYFGGNILTTYKCLNCGTESRQNDSFRDLHLSFPDTESIINHSVQDLLDYYCSKEKLDDDNKYYCDQCKSLCVGERFVNIVSAPQHLILTLKHFKYDQKYNMRAKLMNKVRHEEIINIKEKPTNDCEEKILSYRLYAAVVHSGVSMETGHYFTYGGDHTGWYKFDDNYVCKSNISDLHNLQPPNTPYILFYELIQTTNSHLAINPNNGNIANANTYDNSVKLYEYPALEDLPPQLREYVNRDNISYFEEIRPSKISTSWNRIRNIDFHGPDDNDDPPSSCGSNFAPSYNRYIT